MQSIEAKIIPRDQLNLHFEGLRSSKKIISTNGCFDILHWGHIHYLNDAKALGDILVVGINSDASVKRLKGPARPIFAEAIRLRQVAALGCVDYVTLFDEETPVEFLRLVRPHTHVKGGDYRGKQIPELSTVSEWGGIVDYIEFVPGFSTTELARKIGKL